MRDDMHERIAAIAGRGQRRAGRLRAARWQLLERERHGRRPRPDRRASRSSPTSRASARATSRRCACRSSAAATSVRRDSRQSPPVAIVNETFVRKAIGDADPLGRVVRLETRPGTPVPTFEIVGVARDAKHTELRQDFEPLVVLAATQAAESRRLGALRRSSRASRSTRWCRPWRSASARSIPRSISTSRC